MTIHPATTPISTATRMRSSAPPSPICRRRATTMTTTPTWPSVRRSTRLLSMPRKPPATSGSPRRTWKISTSAALAPLGTDFRRLTPHPTGRHAMKRNAHPSNFLFAHALFEGDRFRAGGEWGC